MIVAQLHGVPDHISASLFEEFHGALQAMRTSDWEKVSVKGGKICEIAFCIAASKIDGTPLTTIGKPANMVDACRKLERSPERADVPRAVRLQIPRMIVAAYELRNNRGAAHAHDTLRPNVQDAFAIFSLVRWIIAELVREFSVDGAALAAKLGDSVGWQDVPIIWKDSDRRRVLNPEISTRDQVLLLTATAGGVASADEVRDWIEYKNKSRFRSQVLGGLHSARLIEFDQRAEEVRITPLGSKRANDLLRIMAVGDA